MNKHHTLAPPFYFLANNLVQLGLFRAFHSLAYAAFFPAATALVLGSSTQKRWGEALGWLTTAIQSALVLSPALGDLLLNHYGFKAVFYSSGVIPSSYRVGIGHGHGYAGGLRLSC
jgi:predicted MFS family arabinose efflux permease